MLWEDADLGVAKMDVILRYSSEMEDSFSGENLCPDRSKSSKHAGGGKVNQLGLAGSKKDAVLQIARSRSNRI
jgi:hypothetical protein